MTRAPVRWNLGVVALVCSATLAGTAVAPTGLARAQTLETQRESLRGLEGVEVVVENLPAEVEREGLTSLTLHAAIERQLQDAGVRALKPGDRLGTPGAPFLYVVVADRFIADWHTTHPEFPAVDGANPAESPSR